MTVFTFTTQGIEVGYGEDGFFAFGETTTHEFDEREWPGHDLPRFRDQPISWRIDIGGKNMWDDYVAGMYPPPLTERAEVLKSFFEEYSPPIGMLWKWEPDSISLSYSLPADPALAAFIMGVMAADREIVFWCQGFQFVDEGKLAPAPTVSGFMERKEPVFLYQLPTLRMK